MDPSIGLPRFDSGACFAALLGTAEQGRWLIGPRSEVRQVRRRYRDATLRPLSDERCDIVRIVEGLQGCVRMRLELAIRYDYGRIVPWVRQADGVLLATAGLDTLELRSAAPLHGEGMKMEAEFDVEAGQRIPFVLNYRASHASARPALQPERALC